MPTINMHQAKSQLSKLVRMAEDGEEIIIARNGRPAVKLVPASPGPRRLGLWAKDRVNQPPGWDEKIPLEEIFPDLFD